MNSKKMIDSDLKATFASQVNSNPHITVVLPRNLSKPTIYYRCYNHSYSFITSATVTKDYDTVWLVHVKLQSICNRISRENSKFFVYLELFQGQNDNDIIIS